MYKNNKINTIDLFAGCGGLLEGFEHHGSYETLACVEWEKAPVENLRKRLENKWRYQNAFERVIFFDIQRTQEVFNGFSSDPIYGSHLGLDHLINDKKVNVVIGGPPCQAYSIAGRVRDADGMKNDYRNYLFESYLKIVSKYNPNFFIFENVQGMLSAKPGGMPIIEKIAASFNEAGYEVIPCFKDALFDLTEYGIPQNRKRVIILGVNKKIYKENSKKIISKFYNDLMPNLKTRKKTVKDTIGDLPKLFPLKNIISKNGHKFSHNLNDDPSIYNHVPRFHNKRDIEIFRLLAKDLEQGTNKYTSTEKLKELYFEMTGKRSNIHKYYVLRWNEQSNTIPAHLYKDGLRHIHPDSDQARSITVREAARLQTFDDDYEFICGRMHQYKMIGNAVPPKFSYVLATALKQIIDLYGLE